MLQNLSRKLADFLAVMGTTFRCCEALRPSCFVALARAKPARCKAKCLIRKFAWRPTILRHKDYSLSDECLLDIQKEFRLQTDRPAWSVCPAVRSSSCSGKAGVGTQCRLQTSAQHNMSRLHSSPAFFAASLKSPTIRFSSVDERAKSQVCRRPTLRRADDTGSFWIGVAGPAVHAARRMCCPCALLRICC